MKKETALFLFCLTLPFCGFTQIVKNAQSFGGYTQLGYQSQLVDYAVNSSTKTTQTNFDLLPRYARFLTDRLMVEARPIVGFRSDNMVGRLDTSFSSPPSSNSEFRNETEVRNLGLSLGARYYLLHDTKVKLFAEGRAGLLHRNIKFSFLGRENLSGSSNVYNLGASVGSNYFISKNIAIEATANFDRVVYSKNGPKENVLSFDLGLRNFIADFKSEEGDAQKSVVAQNRFTIDGRVSYQKRLNSSNSLSSGEIFRVKVSYAHFILRGWLLGGTYNHQSRFSNVRNNPVDTYLENRVNAFDVLASDYSATIFTRYYIPLGKKLFIHPHAQFSIGESPFIFHTNATVSLGGSYFLTRDVAIEATLIEKSFNSRLGDPIFGGANIGIRYFLGK